MEKQNERRVAVIIEDDADIRHLLETILSQAGFETVATGNGLDGVQAVRAHNPVVTTLDVSMPGIDGFEAAKRIREFSDTYLVMLTARDEEIDTLQGLDAGADDYLTKPFRPRELRARIEAMLRRPRRGDEQHAPPQSAASPPENTPMMQEKTGEAEESSEPDRQHKDAEGWVEYNGLHVNPEMRLVEKDNAEITLTRSEFDLLAALLSSQRRVRSKADLALLLRGESYVTDHYISETDKRAIEVHMANLRRKLADSISTPRWIETVRGVGYRLAAPENE